VQPPDAAPVRPATGEPAPAPKSHAERVAHERQRAFVRASVLLRPEAPPGDGSGR
jgi:hypothetical protein